MVTWAHGTTGLGDQCAGRRRQADAASAVPYVKQLVDAGYVVAATDYEGLGTPGVHPYLVGESEGAACSTPRAARRLSGSGAADRVLIAGHSQGGQSALFAGELASSYAPELDVLGVAAAAPAADVEHILPLAANINGAAGYLAMGVQGFHAAYPDADPAAVLSPDAEAKSEAATTQCSDEVMDAFEGTSGSAVLAHDPLSIPAIQTLLHQNSAGNRPAGAPVLIVQGSADTTIPKALTDTFDAKACAARRHRRLPRLRRRHPRHGDRRRAGRRGRLAQGPGGGQARTHDLRREPHRLVALVEELVLLDRVGGLVVLDRLRRLVRVDRFDRQRLLRVSIGSWASFASLLSSMSSLSVLSHQSRPRRDGEPGFEVAGWLECQSSRRRWRPRSVRRMTAWPSRRRWSWSPAIWARQPASRRLGRP